MVLKILNDRLLLTINEQLRQETCIFNMMEPLATMPKELRSYLQKKNIEILGPWLGYFPDINPIKNLWTILKKNVHLQKPTNINELKTLL